MRLTWTSLYKLAQSYTNDNGTNLAFLKDEVNRAQRYVFAELKNYIGVRSQTASTVAAQQYYHLPPDCIDIDSVTVTIGSVVYTLRSTDSQMAWDTLNAVTFTSSAIPERFFERKADFGIWPIPQAVYTITLNYVYAPRDMSQDDYTTNTINLTNGSTAVTGNGTAFITAMAGRWLQGQVPNGDGLWYKIASVTDGADLVLETAYEGTTVATTAYTIGESPELPEEALELLPARAAQMYYGALRVDKEMARTWGNIFYTGDPDNDSRRPTDCRGGLLGLAQRYSARSNSAIIQRNVYRTSLADSKIWATSIH